MLRLLNDQKTQFPQVSTLSVNERDVHRFGYYFR